MRMGTAVILLSGASGAQCALKETQAGSWSAEPCSRLAQRGYRLLPVMPAPPGPCTAKALLRQLLHAQEVSWATSWGSVHFGSGMTPASSKAKAVQIKACQGVDKGRGAGGSGQWVFPLAHVCSGLSWHPVPAQLGSSLVMRGAGSNRAGPQSASHGLPSGAPPSLHL